MAPDIDIKSSHHSELTTKVTVDNVSYIVHTEGVGKSHTKASSKVFAEGKVVFSKSADYSHLVGKHDINRKLSEFMGKLHKSVIKEFTNSLLRKQIKKTEFFELAKSLLKKNKGPEALKVLQEGLEVYPSDPFLLSYYGCLLSIISKKHAEGVNICRDAISKLNQTIPIGREYFYPSFYLNLGRAYLGGGKKRDAVKAFNLGLKADPDDAEILEAMNNIGSRRRPPISFLERSSPINKYIGTLLKKASKSS